MSMRYPGGLIATSPVNAQYPSGVWTQSQTIPYQQQNVWQKDQFWPNVTLLLPGNGTNGAQNNTFLDSSTNNFTITRNGNTTQGTFTPYGVDWSNYFNGSTDYLTMPDISAYVLSGDFTMEAWIFPTSFAGTNGNIILAQWPGAIATNQSFQFYITSTGKVGLGYGIGGTNAGVTGSSLSCVLNTWNHVAVTRSGSTVRFFVNGALDATTATVSGSFNDSTGVMSVGRINAADSGYFSGYISNCRLVVGSALYTAAFNPSTTPLTAVSGTQVLTCQSNRFIDNSSNNAAITVGGSPSVQSFSPFSAPSNYSTSIIGGSGYFPNVLTTGNNVTYSNYLTLTDAGVNLSGTSYTMEAWVYPTQAPSGSPPQENLWVFDWYSAYNNRWGLTFNTTKIELYSDGPSISLQGSGAVPVNAWTHLAASWDGTTTRLFINGALITSNTTNYARNLSTLNVGRGRYSFGSITDLGALPGYMAGARIVKGSAIYTAAFTPPTAPPTAVANTALLLNYTNAGIIDNAMMNDLETVGNAQISTSVVKYGTGSMYFDGTGDYLVSPLTPNFSFGTGNFTIEGWVYIAANSSANASSNRVANIASTLRATSPSGFEFAIDGNTTTTGTGIYFNNWVSGTSYTISATTTIAQGAWNHLAVVRNGTATTIYVNGVSVASGTLGNQTISPIDNLWIGANNNSNYLHYLNGYIDDLRITKGVARYITNFTPPPARMPQQ